MVDRRTSLWMRHVSVLVVLLAASRGVFVNHSSSTRAHAAITQRQHSGKRLHTLRDPQVAQVGCGCGVCLCYGCSQDASIT